MKNLKIAAPPLSHTPRKELQRFIRFAFVGALGFLVGFGTVIALQNTVLPPRNSTAVTLITCISLTIAASVKFVASCIWVYPESRPPSRRRQLAQFAIISLIGLALRNLWIHLTYQPLGHYAVSFIETIHVHYEPSPIERNKLGTSVAWLLAIALGMFWNFFANRYWTFRDID